jgi:probable F420-dependent oxidoreductase
VKFGVNLSLAPRNWVPVTGAAEEAGFDSVWLPEHLIMPVKMTGKPGSPREGDAPISADTPAWDPWLAITWLAGQTSTIRFGTNVYNIGLRHPFVVARSLMTADLLSEGRVEFGIGASWLQEEWDAVELPFETRGRRVDETIRILQRLFTEDVVEHEGEFFRFQPVKFQPKPVQQPWPPMLIGGDSPAAIRRAAALGDGWIPMAQTLDTLAANLKRIAELRDGAGRDGRFEVTVHGVRDATYDNLRQYEDLGVHRILVAPWTSGRDAVDGVGRFADDVLTRFA